MERREEDEDGESIVNVLELVPLDLVPDILLRLPAKSVVRSRCVSKLWSFITTRPCFMRSFAIHSSTHRLRLLGCIRTSHPLFFISLSQQDEHPTTDVLHYQINSPIYDPCSESVQGLVCYGDFNRIQVWNPSMRQHVTLPKPEPEPRVKSICSCLGHDPVEDKYKVRCEHPLVFTLGPQESWRVIQDSPLHSRAGCLKTGIGICINGHVYYHARIRFKVDDDSYEYEEMLMSFDVRYERFSTIKKPVDPVLGNGNDFLHYEGKLAWLCCCIFPMSPCIRFWVLEDEEKQEWSLRNFILPLPRYPQLDTGEFIFTATRFNGFQVLYYDPKTNRERRITYEGIRDNELWIRNASDKTFSDVDWFPNHSESLMSLGNVPCLSNISTTDSE